MNALVQPIGRKIKIKTEHGIRRNIRIKNETHATPKSVRNHQQNNNNNPKQAPTNFEREKQKLIKAFVDQKAVNQNITLDLNQKKQECMELISAKMQLEQEAAFTSAKIADLNSNLSLLKAEYAQKSSEYEREISNLRRQNQTLSAQNKQLQTARSQKDDKNDDENAENVFDVESILNDKIQRKVRYFLVRWKGFSSEHDSWVREVDLMCPSILENYLQSKRKN